MSRLEAPRQVIDTTRSAARLGLVLVAGSSLAPTPAVAAEPLHIDSVGINQHGAHNQALPPRIEQIMQRDTVYLTGLHCSGKALHGQDGRFIGVITANHCSLQDTDNERLTGDDGKTYIVQPKPVVAKIGAHWSSLRKAGEINRFIVPAAKDTTHDIALGVMADSTPGEVIAAYRQQALTPRELRQLRVGDKIYMAGWPQKQAPRNPRSEQERQEFGLKLTGFGRIRTTKNPALDVLWSNVSSTNDAATTSFGASGSVGFTILNGRERTVGPLSAFNDLKGDVAGSSTATNTLDSRPVPKLQGQNATADAGFSYLLRTPHQGHGQILYSVRSMNEIPGYVSPEQAAANARADFKNPDISKTVINGDVQIYLKSTGPPPIIDNPVLFRDARHGQNVFVWADPADPDHLQFLSVRDRELYSVSVTSHDAAPPAFTASAGALTYQPDIAAFTDSNGLAIGGNAENTIDYSNGTYSLLPGPDGQLSFASAGKGGK